MFLLVHLFITCLSFTDKTEFKFWFFCFERYTCSVTFSFWLTMLAFVILLVNYSVPFSLHGTALFAPHYEMIFFTRLHKWAENPPCRLSIMAALWGTTGVVWGWEATFCSKTTMAAHEDDSVDAAIASVTSEVGSISSLKEEQRKFVDLIGWS